jgi:hypothetical protein
VRCGLELEGATHLASSVGASRVRPEGGKPTKRWILLRGKGRRAAISFARGGFIDDLSLLKIYLALESTAADRGICISGPVSTSGTSATRQSLGRSPCTAAETGGRTRRSSCGTPLQGRSTGASGLT